MSNLKRTPSLGRLSTITTMSETPTNEIWSIGDRCSSTGRVGTVAFIGRTQFADGDWVGVVLDKPEGKNDGSINGIRYFECAANHGLFCRPGKITRIGPNPLDDSFQEGNELPEQLRAHESSPGSSHQYGQFGYDIGDQVYITGGKVGTVKFLGPVHFAAGTWAGIKLDTQTGKNDGSVMGKRYFECENGYGIFVKADQPKKVTPKPGLLPIRHTKTSALRTMKDGGDVETQSCASSTCSSRMGRSPMHAPKLNVVPASKAHEEAMNTLKTYLKEKENHVVSLTTELDQARGEIGVLMQKLQKSEASHSHKTPEVPQQVQEELKKVQAEREEISRKILDLEEIISQQKEEIETLKFESEEKRILEQELKEIKEAKRRDEDTDINSQILLNEDIQKLQQEKLQLVSQLEESQSRIQQLEDQNKGSDNVLQANIQEMNVEKQKLEEQLKMSNNKVAELEEKVKNHESLQLAFQETNVEKQKLVDELTQTSTLITELQLKLKDQEHLKSTLDAISDEKSSLQTELDTVKERNLQLEQDLKKMLDASQQENASLDSTLQVLQSEKHRLNIELEQALLQAKTFEEELKETKTLLQTQLDNAISDKSILNKELDDIKNKNVDLKKQIQEMIETINKGKVEFQSIHTEKDELNKTLQEALQKTTELETLNRIHTQQDLGDSEKLKLAEEIENLKIHNDELDKKLKELFDSSNKDKTVFDSNIEILKNEKETLGQELDQTRLNFNKLESELQETKTKLQAQLDSTILEKSNLTKELDEIKANKNEIEQRLQQILDNSNKNESELKTEVQKLNLSKSETEKLLSETKQHVIDLEKRLRDVLDSSNSIETNVRQELERHVSEKEKLQSELAETKQTMLQFQATQEELKSSKSEIDNQLSILQQQFGILENKHIEVVDKNNEETLKLKQELQQNIELKEKLHSELAETKQVLQLTQAEIEELKKSKDEISKLMESTKQQANDIEKQLQDLKASSMNTETNLKQELHQHIDQKVALELALNEVKQSVLVAQAEIESLTKSKSDIEQQLTETQKQAKDLEAQLQKVMDSSSNIELHVKQESQRHIEEKENMKTELEQAKQSLIQAQAENEEVKKWQIEAQRKIADSDAKLNEKLESEAQLMREVEALQTLCSMEKSEKEALQTKLTHQATQQETYENSSKQQQEQIIQLQNNLKEVEKANLEKVSGYELQLKNLNKSFDEAQNMIDEMTKKLSQVEQEKGLDNEKIKEIDSLKAEISHITLEKDSLVQKYKEEIDQLRQREQTAQNDIVTLNEKLVRLQNVPPPSTDIADYLQQIDFLNSIIAQKQRDISHLKAQNDLLLLGEPVYDGPTKKDKNHFYQKVARSYCDICEEFDLHETEDCPKQSSDYNEMNEHTTTMPGLNGGSSVVITPSKSTGKKVKPPPRAYCDHCEEFGHDISECKKKEID
uniref:CAP-Gly domain-containing protein n=1 Tax=Acrobeloides nanus TaxID=290746 RepID=A0A914CX66_9BILA